MKSSNTPTVWIVDDDEEDILFIGSAFRDGQPSINSLALNSGAELLATLGKCVELPRLILLDINMPLKNGFETLEELRSMASFKGLPVIMLTTSSNEDDRQRSLALGANQFLTKPLTYEQLRTLAQELSRDWELA